ncbi:hypothetical protein KUL152_10000 [Tenacibaculum sp. KUL152]|nr:hypothetical protein KUL152_10000 [Tenacibaculum sp. KUL152]
MTLNDEKFSCSAFGIVARIADFYGMSSALELLRRLDIPAPKAPMDYSSELIDAVMDNATISYDAERFMTWLADTKTYEERYPAIAYSKKFRACKHCLREGIIHQEHWQKIHYTHCLTHSIPLTDSCVHIYADNEWEEDEIGCKRCVYDVEAARTPHYLRHWDSFTDKAQADAFIHQLLHIAELMFRPFDFFHTQIAWDKLSVSDTTSILENAFILAGKAEATAVWAKLVKDHRASVASLGNMALNYGLDKIKSALGCVRWDTSDTDINIAMILNHYHTQHDKRLLRTRYHIGDEDTGDTVSFKASGAVIGTILDVDCRGLTELVADEVLPVKKNSARFDKLIFDVRDVASAIRDIFVFPLSGHIQAVSVARTSQKVLDTLLLDSKRITTALISGRLKGYWAINSTESLINRSTLSASSLTELFEDELENSQHLSIVMTAKLLGIQTPGVKGLVQRGLLRWAPWQRTCAHVVDIESIKTFFANYVCINREAILKDKSVTAIVDDISNCCGKSPDVRFNEFRDPTTVVLYKKATLAPCCADLATNQLEALKKVGIDLSKKVKRFANAA